MLIAALASLGAALLLGSVLAFLQLRMEGVGAPPWPLAKLHGLLAVGGLACLLLALRGPQRGLATGTASFGMVAAALIALAALVGLGMLAAHLLKSRFAVRLIGVHATLAVSGFVFLAAYALLG